MPLISQLNLIFQEVFDDPGLILRPDTNPNDIADWDSVAQLKLVLAIEEAFGTRLTADEVTGLNCVDDFITALNRPTGAAA